MLKFIAKAVLLLCVINAQAQQSQDKKAERYISSRGEIYLKFDTRKYDPLTIGKDLSLDHKTEGHYQYAYANLSQFQKLHTKHIDFEIQTPPSLLNKAKMAKKADQLLEWNQYPSYDAYVEFMEKLAQQYPNFCKLEEFGQSLEGRKLLALKISDNPHSEEAEPDFLYTSTMHGDETTGYVLLLRLANYLLENQSDERILDLISNTEIWINPLANPDGTYATSNETVNGATRNNRAINIIGSNNKKGIDLNRNFAGPRLGPHPDNNEWQPETEHMMNFMKQHNFVLVANFHSGAELVNYPWDTWFHNHADNSWYENLSRQYADTVHKNSISGYFDDMENGITNGATWYVVDGGRQDYTNYYLHGREVTIELSEVKMPLGSQLPFYWNAHYRSLLNYIKETHYGITGIISNSETGQPIRAKVEVVGHDIDNSEIYSEEKNGNYHRLISPNTYTLKFSKDGYRTLLVENINVKAKQATLLNIELIPSETSLDKLGVESVKLYPNPLSVESQLSFELNKQTDTHVAIASLSGKIFFSQTRIYEAGQHSLHFPNLDLPNGVYLCNIRLGEQQKQMKILVAK